MSANIGIRISGDTLTVFEVLEEYEINSRHDDTRELVTVPYPSAAGELLAHLARDHSEVLLALHAEGRRAGLEEAAGACVEHMQGWECEQAIRALAAKEGE